MALQSKHWGWGLLASAWAIAIDTAAEPRLRSDEHPRAWSPAIVRLRTASLRRSVKQHYTEHCTASLIASGPKPLLVTAWHCVEGQIDLAHPPHIELNGNWLPVRVLATGGSMTADWAILQTTTAVSQPYATLPLFESHALVAGTPMTLAGFSRDPGLGDRGNKLTYHEDCQIITELNHRFETDCLAYRGASGGAALIVDGDGQTRLAGVISAGDSLHRSIIVPISRFRHRIPH